LPHQHVGSLCTSSEAALPGQLRVLSRTMRIQRLAEGIVKHGGSSAIAALRTPTNHDLEATYHRLFSLTGMRRHVNHPLLHASGFLVSATTTAWTQLSCRSCPVHAVAPGLPSRI